MVDVSDLVRKWGKLADSDREFAALCFSTARHYQQRKEGATDPNVLQFLEQGEQLHDLLGNVVESRAVTLEVAAVILAKLNEKPHA